MWLHRQVWSRNEDMQAIGVKVFGFLRMLTACFVLDCCMGFLAWKLDVYMQSGEHGYEGIRRESQV